MGTGRGKAVCCILETKAESKKGRKTEMGEKGDFSSQIVFSPLTVIHVVLFSFLNGALIAQDLIQAQPTPSPFIKLFALILPGP